MNILFIGPYRQNDGWGLAARDYISCLSTIEEYTVSCVPIYMSNNISRELPWDILQAEQTYCDNFDVIIQNVLPNFFEKHNGYNIGIYYSETHNLKYSLFIDKINLLDELWVSSESEKEELQKSGVNIKISIVPIPMDTDLLDKNLNIMPLDIQQTQNSFNFYMLAEYAERKNIEAGIIAFNREFYNDKNVSLTIKTRINHLNDEQNQKHISETVLNLKKKLRLFNHLELYTNEILITSRMNEQQICSLHKTGDCLLVPSRGEAYCRPVLEALYFGNQVICTEDIHTQSIVPNQCIFVKSHRVPIVIDNPPAPHIYTGWETWNEIDILELQKQMRRVFNERYNQPISHKDWVKENFSYQNIANTIKKILCQL